MSRRMTLLQSLLPLGFRHFPHAESAPSLTTPKLRRYDFYGNTKHESTPMNKQDSVVAI
jgi:hypothetical protein